MLERERRKFRRKPTNESKNPETRRGIDKKSMVTHVRTNLLRED
jgi:hypothetical protein